MTESIRDIHDQVIAGSDMVESSGVFALEETVNAIHIGPLGEAIKRAHVAFQELNAGVEMATGISLGAYYGTDGNGYGSAPSGATLVTNALQGSLAGRDMGIARENMEGGLRDTASTLQSAHEACQYMGRLLEQLMRTSEHVQGLVDEVQGTPVQNVSQAAGWIIAHAHAFVESDGSDDTTPPFAR
jgi:hypothetical protein